MLKLLERHIATVEQRLILLAPPGVVPTHVFPQSVVEPRIHRQLVRDMQQLRGAVYLGDGAVQRHQLAPDGSHQTPEDARSWHLLFVKPGDQVSACAWYLPHDPAAGFNELRMQSCALAHAEGWRHKVRAAVEGEIDSARRQGIRFSEVGGWAVSRENRCTTQGLLLALAAYSLGRVLGGTISLTTATVRHSSSTILRRIGGASLQAAGAALPSYFDPKYGCEMELLRFDSRQPSARYSRLVDFLTMRLAHVRVVASHARDSFRFPRPLPTSVPTPELAGANAA